MTLTSNELIMIATPLLVTLMAGLSVYFFNRDLMRRRVARKAEDNSRDEPDRHVWVRLTADESAIVRKLLEKDLQEKTGDERPSVVSGRLVAGRR